MKKVLVFILSLLVFFSVTLFAAQADTVKAFDVAAAPPVIDADGSDLCWNQAAWQPIDEHWLEYGVDLDSTDFWARYKVIWSSETNLLYFLAEVVDDTFVSGYTYARSQSEGGGYPNYDILEIFIDQDKSGGLHVFDGTGQTGIDWGTNAENAFSYHLTPLQDPDAGLVTDIAACDLGGETWWSADGKGMVYVANYADHVPEFALIQSEGIYTWEFSLKVYDDTYTEEDPESALVTLQEGDMMGLSLAYCDNDNEDEDPLQRDHFIGSVWVPEAAQNDHWKDADGFGTLMLVDETTGIEAYQNRMNSNLEIYPNPGNGTFTVKTASIQSSPINVRVFNILGQTVYRQKITTGGQINAAQINLNHLPNGIYIMSVEMDSQIFNKRIRILRN